MKLQELLDECLKMKIFEPYDEESLEYLKQREHEGKLSPVMRKMLIRKLEQCIEMTDKKEPGAETRQKTKI